VLTIAIPKGSLLADSVKLLAAVGLDFSVLLDKSNRQLQVTDPTGKARAMLVRNGDVPV
jgi:ATP phosphoribosyltransferase